MGLGPLQSQKGRFLRVWGTGPGGPHIDEPSPGRERDAVTALGVGPDIQDFLDPTTNWPNTTISVLTRRESAFWNRTGQRYRCWFGPQGPPVAEGGGEDQGIAAVGEESSRMVAVSATITASATPAPPGFPGRSARSGIRRDRQFGFRSTPGSRFRRRYPGTQSGRTATRFIQQSAVARNPDAAAGGRPRGSAKMRRIAPRWNEPAPLPQSPWRMPPGG